MDVLYSLLALLGFVALTASTGVFVAIEFALTGMERSTIETAARTRGDTPARAVLKAHNTLSFQLSGAQLGITLTTLATGFLAEPVLARFFTPLLELFGMSDTSATAVALVLALIIATILSMVYGELVPKNMAISRPMATARYVVLPVMAFNRVFALFIRGMNNSANFLVRKLGIEPADELASARSPQELAALVRNSAQHGSLKSADALLLDRSLKFGETSAEDLMTPRSTVEFLQATDTVIDLLKVASETGHSRFPVADGDLDDTIGVVHVKDAFSVPAARRYTTTVGSLAKPVPVLPTSLDGDAVLNRVRAAGSQVALIADEYGGTAGIVTIEDVVEEILGEVYDEYDDAEAEREIRRTGSHSWNCSGLVRVDELAHRIGYFPPEGPYESLGGLLMTVLGRIPQEGDRVLLPETERDALDEFESGIPGRWYARVAQMDGRRIDRAVLTPITAEQAKEMFHE
ncbi:hemolysin family protein [Corynebacterium ulceribovis]|uniref:hemolysin family protein n=1 Tax=Corynebacterium ulceribovis TaxID=487732 RepID=UPI00037204D2|nr:hemolysin family protein [Corynebacterium ulceribovis]